MTRVQIFEQNSSGNERGDGKVAKKRLGREKNAERENNEKMKRVKRERD